MGFLGILICSRSSTFGRNPQTTRRKRGQRAPLVSTGLFQFSNFLGLFSQTCKPTTEGDWLPRSTALQRSCLLQQNEQSGSQHVFTLAAALQRTQQPHIGSAAQPAARWHLVTKGWNSAACLMLMRGSCEMGPGVFSQLNIRLFF